MRLIQKHFLKSTREFEIVDDSLFVRIKSPFKVEKLTLGLSILNPEPVINGKELEFHGRVKSGALLSLLLNKPNADEFNAFVDTLKQRVLEEQVGISGVTAARQTSSQPEGLDRNVFEEPTGFEQSGESRDENTFEPVSSERVEGDIVMLRTYLDETDIQPLLSSLESLKAEPKNEAAFQKVLDAYNGLGFQQGAVLTYAPYLKILLSRSIWS